MNILRTLIVVGLGAVAVACGGASASDTAPTDQGDEQDVTAALSQGLLCAAVSAANDSNGGQGFASLDKSSLKGDALSDYKAFQKGMVSDYPSEAFTMPVKLGTKTYNFVLVIENNDGGGSMGIYRTTNGSTIATVSGSESGEWTWSKPADKCPDQ